MREDNRGPDPGRREADFICGGRNCPEIIDSNTKADEKIAALKLITSNGFDTITRAVEEFKKEIKQDLQDHVDALEKTFEIRREGQLKTFDAEVEGMKSSNAITRWALVVVVTVGLTAMWYVSLSGSKLAEIAAKDMKQAIISLDDKVMTHSKDNLQRDRYFHRHQQQVMQSLAEHFGIHFGPYGPDGQLIDPSGIPTIRVDQ